MSETEDGAPVGMEMSPWTAGRGGDFHFIRLLDYFLECRV